MIPFILILIANILCLFVICLYLRLKDQDGVVPPQYPSRIVSFEGYPGSTESNTT